jgi:deazaflavin-dependent oxidoreductase (nitroreductase family)
MNLIERMAVSDWFRAIGPKTVPRMDKFVHKVSGGRFTMSGLYTPVLVLTTIGRKSGEPRTVPIATFRYGDAFVVVGSNFGREHHPAWSHNLLANPEATVEFRKEKFPVKARLATDDERAELWEMITRQMENFERYPERSGRDLRVFILERS